MLQLKKFPDIPVSTREEARDSCPHPEEPVSISYLERRDTFPACSGKNSRRSRRISRGGALHRKGERYSRVVPPFPVSPRCLSPFQGILFSLHCLDFQAENRLTPWWHVGQPCGKASRESHRSLDPREGKRDSAARAREESARACPHRDKYLLLWGDSRRTPRSKSSLERIPQVPARTTHKVLGPGIDGRGIPRPPNN